MKNALYSIASIVALLVAIALGFFVAPYTADYRDELYEIMNAWDYRTVPMAPLSSFLSGIFGHVFGFGYLTFKYLAWCLNILGVAVAGLWAWRLCGSWRKAVLFSAVALVLTVLLAFCEDIYGWDSYSITLSSMVMVASLWYMQRPSPWRIAAVALLVAVAALMRMPNAVAGAVALLAVVVSRQMTREKWRDAVILVAVAVAATLVILLALFGSWGAYIDSVDRFMISDHGYMRLKTAIIDSGVSMLTYMALIAAVDYLIVKIWPVLRSRLLRLLLVAALILLLRFMLRLHLCSWLPYDILGLRPACVLMIVIMIAFCRPLERNRLAAMAVIAAAMFIPTFGSNLGLNKCLIFAPLPILFCYFPDVLRGTRLATFVTVAAAVILVYIGVIHKACDSKFNLGDGFRPVEVDCYNALRGIRLPEDKALELNGISAELSGVGIVYPVGEDIQHRFLYEYLYGWTNPMLRHEWTRVALFDDAGYALELAALADTIPAGAAVLYLPQSERTTTDNVAFQALSERLTPVVSTPTFTIFRKQ